MLIDDSENINDMLNKPASSSGKYHSKLVNGIGGIYLHTLECLHIAKRILLSYEGLGKCSGTDSDIVYSALILHDAFKYVTEDFQKVDHVTKEHAYSAYLKILQYDNGKDFVRKIADAVRYHNSCWGHTPEEIKLASDNFNIINSIVIVADMISSMPNKETLLIPK
jgi:HD superfamily phosphodiesterase